MVKKAIISADLKIEQELFAKAKNSDSDEFAALIRKYMPLVKSRVQLFAGCGIEKDDLIQEGLIGLASAIGAYTPNISKFATFAKICIDRSLIAVVRRCNKGSVIPKELFVETIYSETGAETHGSDETNPEKLFFARDQYLNLQRDARSKLSDLEYNIFCYYLNGYSYTEISHKLSLSAKSVDNAIQRIRRKLK